MTDSGRKDISSKISDAVTPDSSKGPIDHSKDAVSGKADHVARDAVPDSSKSTTQEAADKVSRTKESSLNKTGHESTADKIKDKLHMGGNKSH